MALLRDKRLQHLLYGAIPGLGLMWSLKAGLSPGLEIHFLGMTTLTLIFGWDLAICAGTIALAGLTLPGKESLQLMPVTGIWLVVVPALVTKGILVVVEWRLPRNLFVYLLLVAFFGGGVATATGGTGLVLTLIAADLHTVEKVIDEYWLLLPLIMFPEALLNGILMTGMLVYFPDWVRTFDARRYLDSP